MQIFAFPLNTDSYAAWLLRLHVWVMKFPVPESTESREVLNPRAEEKPTKQVKTFACSLLETRGLYE